MTFWKSSSGSGPPRADHPAGRADPGAVDGDPQLAELRRRVDRGLHLRLVPHVGGHEAARARRARRRAAAPGEDGQVDDDDRRAVGGEPAGGGAAEAGGAAGDERDGGRR